VGEIEPLCDEALMEVVTLYGGEQRSCGEKKRGWKSGGKGGESNGGRLGYASFWGRSSEDKWGGGGTGIVKGGETGNGSGGKKGVMGHQDTPKSGGWFSPKSKPGGSVKGGGRVGKIGSSTKKNQVGLGKGKKTRFANLRALQCQRIAR